MHQFGFPLINLLRGSMFWVRVSLDFDFVFVAEAYDLFVVTLLVVILLKFTSDVIFWF